MRFIVICKDRKDQRKLQSMEMAPDSSYRIIRSYRRSEWHPDRRGYVVECDSKNEKFKLAILFEVLEHRNEELRL